MFEMALLSLRVRFSSTANRIIYFLRNLPVLKHILPSTLHGEYTLKTIFTVFGALIIGSKKIFTHMLTMLILLVVAVAQHQLIYHGGIFGLFDSPDLFAGLTASGVAHFAILTWLIMYVPFSFASSDTAEVKLTYKNDDIMINYLNADPAIYAKSNILISQIAHILLYTPYLLLAFFLAEIPIWSIITALIIVSAYRLFGEMINLVMFKSFKFHFGKGALGNIVGVIAIVAAIFLPLVAYPINLSLLFTSPVFLVFSAIIGFLSLQYIRNYTLYRPLLVEKTKWMLEQMNKAAANKGNSSMSASAYFADAKKWSKNVSAEDLNSEKYSNKSGFAYLNAIFFARHSSYFKKKILTRIYFLLLIPIITMGFLIYESITNSNLIYESLGLNPGDLEYVFSFAPTFFFIIYISSMGRVVTASIFSNCDIQMLHYPYYRTRENIFSSFKSRFAVILKHNLLITSLMAVFVLICLTIIFGHFHFMLYVTFLLVLISMGVLFAFNDLFLYYVIQPYDSKGQSKSTVYSIINFVIYVIAWLNFSERFPFYTYAVIVFVGTVVYIGLGLILLAAFAPKRFRLR